MYDEKRFFDSAEDWLIAWAGMLSAEELEMYLHEHPGTKDNAPQSAFAADLGRAYDHDLINGHASDESTSLRHLTELNGLDDEALVKDLESRCAREVRCYLILWNAKRTDSQDRLFANGKLHCLGSWQHPSPFRGF
jgi:hypothetical protein